MNKIKMLAVIAFGLVLSVPVFAQTNSPMLEDVKQTAKATVSTNLNQVMIEILSGVKSASGEIYDASKGAIRKSVDFVAEQAPDVVKQFLYWKIAQSVLYLLAFGGVAVFFLCISVKLKKYARKDGDDDAMIFGWVIQIISTTVLIFTVFCNCSVITQIIVAPKVYIIEYVVALAQNHR